MAKGGKSGKRGSRNPNQRATGYKHDAPTEDMMDDEIDAFHKQIDIVPLNINEDTEGSDEDDEHPVFDFKDANDDEEDEDEDIGDDDGVVAKIARNLRAKIGGVDDEMYDDAEDEEDKRAVWGKRKNIYYSADNADYESSDEERPAEEEAEALKMQKEKAKLLTLEDFGLEDVSQDESEREPTMEEILFKEKTASKALAEKDAHDDHSVAYEKVKKDLNALSKEEQMDVVYSSAPELVGLLSELNDAVEELENKVNPLLSKVKDVGNTATGGMHYMEVKQLLLLAYCQAISFYLLLKSEGQPVRDHPVIARLVEIKNLLDKMKQLDANLPSELEDILKKKRQTETVMKFLRDDVALTSASVMNGHMVSNGTLEVAVVPHEAAQLVKLDSAQENENKGRNLKNTNNQVGVQSMEMLKVRAALEEKLKQKGIFSSVAPKRDKVQKQKQLLNGQLETLDDFDDDATNKSEGNATTQLSSKLSQLITRTKKSKIISAEDDLPKRDDIGERRRKHELRVLAGAGIKSMDDDEGDGDEPDDFESDEDTEMAEGGEPESEDDFYKQVKQQRAANMAAKAEMYSRNPAMPSMPEETLVDGKRHISSQMEKNRGLTRPRKKLTKNPRKKYKLKHQKAVVRRKGQVRDIKKPTGPYGGETSGINAAISRSIRF